MNTAGVFAVVIAVVMVLVALGSVAACLLWTTEDSVDAHAATAMAALAPDDLPDFTADEWAAWYALQAPDRTPLSTEE